MKYLQGISFSQLTLAVKTDSKKLRRAPNYLVISQLSSSRIQTDVRKCNHDIR
jgi:hypothetical protein